MSTETHFSPEAFSAIREILAGGGGVLAYLKARRAIPDEVEGTPIALLSSHSIEPVLPYLEVEAFLSGWFPIPTTYQYSLWRNVLADPSCLDAKTEAVVLLLDATAAGEAAPENIAAEFQALITRFRENSDLPLFLCRVPVRPLRRLSPLDVEAGNREFSAADSLNAAMASAAETLQSVYVFDVSEELGALGPQWYAASQFAATMTMLSGTACGVVARGIARTLGPMLVPRKRVLVTDLDNTLWRGIVGEDGVEGIELARGPAKHFEAYRGFLKRLRETGVLLAICSKNTEADGLAVFDARGHELGLSLTDFAAHRINWDDKASNIAGMATELGLGLDSFVFVDDNPMECARVRGALPMVTVVEGGNDNAGLVERILETRAFDALVLSEDDRQRAARYETEAARKSALGSVTDMDGFFAAMDLLVTITPFAPDNAERTHQLLQKTNQFNLTLERLSPSELSMHAKQGSVFAISLSDRFGDYGQIGVVDLAFNAEAVEIRNFVLSCRALGRKVEDSVLAHVVEIARARDLRHVRAWFREGPRNAPARQFLDAFAFSANHRDDEGWVFDLSVADGPDWPDCVKRS